MVKQSRADFNLRSLKDYAEATSSITYFLIYADKYMIGYFKKQGFTEETTLDKSSTSRFSHGLLKAKILQ